MAMNIHFSSFNLHGWNNGLSQLSDLCDSHDVICVQEHCLLPGNLNQIQNFRSDFHCFAISGCTDIVNYAIKGGRPFGGLGLFWRKTKGMKVNILGIDDQHRIICAEITYENYKFIVINVYFPCVMNNDDYECEILLLTSFIESMFGNYNFDSNVKIILLGDFNFESVCLDTNPRLIHMNELIKEYNMSVCDSFDVNKVGYTYKHDTALPLSIELYI